MIKQYNNRKFYYNGKYINQKALLKLAAYHGKDFSVTKEDKDVTVKVLVNALRNLEFDVPELLEIITRKVRG